MKYLFIITFFLFSCHLFAQKIDGHVTDSSGTPMRGFDVFISAENGELAALTSTNEVGYFSAVLSNGGILIVTVYDATGMAGRKQIELIDSATVDFIIPRTANLDSVVITVRKPLIVTLIDRIQYNVENSVVSSGADAVEVLAMTPLVRVSDDGIGITGKSGVAVMVDDRIINLSGSDLINYLKSIRAEDIAKIEVITAPPAKYQAEGNSGLINIVLKKGRKRGWSGTVSGTYNQTTYAGGSANATINGKFKKVTSSLKLRAYDRSNHAFEKINLEGESAIKSVDSRKDTYKGLGANLSMDYTPTEKIRMGVVYDLVGMKSLLDITNNTGYFNGNINDSTLTTFSGHNNPSLVQTVNLYTDFTLDTIGRTISISGNHFLSNPQNTVDFQTTGPSSDYIVRNTSLLDYRVASVQADYYGQEKWAMLEGGVRYTLFSNASDVGYYNRISEDYIIDSTKSNRFDYLEKNLAGYFSLTRKLSKKLSFKGGLRYEYSAITGNSLTTGNVTSYNYSSWFPSGYFIYEPNDKHIFNLNYTRRINRPNYSSLNPFRWYSNPYTYYTGNPLLRPSYSDNAELGYTYDGRFSVSLYGQYTTNGFGRTVTIVNQVEKVVNYANYLTMFDGGVNMNFYHGITKWWECYATVSGSYSMAESSLSSILPQKGFSSYYSINNFFILSEKKKIKAQLLFWQNLPSRQANTFSRQINALSIGIRFPLLKERFIVNVTANDVFMGSISKGELYFDGFRQTYNNYYDSRSLNVSITYSFGNKKIVDNTKEVPFDDKYRAN